MILALGSPKAELRDPDKSMSAVIIGEGGPRDPSRLDISTRSRKPIPNVQKPDRRPESLLEARRIWKNKFPDIDNRSLDATYSCVGMIFAIRRAWIEDEHLEWLLAEDGYIEVENPKVGDLIVYRNDRGKAMHVGVIMERALEAERAEWRFRVLSQWGQDGEFLHAASDVPALFGDHKHFYSERKQL